MDSSQLKTLGVLLPQLQPPKFQLWQQLNLLYKDERFNVWGISDSGVFQWKDIKKNSDLSFQFVCL